VFYDHVTGPWWAELAEPIPGLDVIDVHTHIGQNDPDGFTCTTEQLTEGLGAIGARGVVFPMQEPDGYPPANDMVIAESERSGSVLTPFLRLDPEDAPLAEAERALAAGAQGIKLHPRGESFELDHPALADVFALAGERRLPVLVHAGRGIPALGHHAVDLCERHPGLRLILAHACITDLAWIWRAAADLPNLFFDTSWWSASDLLALWTLVPPGQILFASDAPYSTPAFAAVTNLRCALQAGLDADQVRLAFGGQTQRLLSGQDPLDGGPATRTPITVDPLLDRVHTFLVMAIGQALAGEEPAEALTLARLSCAVGDDAPQAPACVGVLEQLDIRDRYMAEGTTDEGRPQRFAPGLQFLIAAAVVARTPGVPAPAAV
jgi:hypothetical protein